MLTTNTYKRLSDEDSLTNVQLKVELRNVFFVCLFFLHWNCNVCMLNDHIITFPWITDKRHLSNVAHLVRFNGYTDTWMHGPLFLNNDMQHLYAHHTTIILHQFIQQRANFGLRNYTKMIKSFVTELYLFYIKLWRGNSCIFSSMI